MDGQTNTGWASLVARQVQMYKEGRPVRTGRVEAVTHTADALWLEAHGADRRALFEKSEGYSASPLDDAPTTEVCE